MGKLLILLLLIAILLWLWKSRRWSDALFGFTVTAGIFTWLSGYELLKSSKSTHWHGVTLISVGLLVMLGLAITLRVTSSKNAPNERDQSLSE